MYSLYLEPMESALSSQVEYDMDEQGAATLFTRPFNANLALHQFQIKRG